MALMAPNAFSIIEGKYGTVRAMSITMNPLRPLKESIFFKLECLLMIFFAESRRKKRSIRKESTTPTVSATTDNMIPGTMPNIRRREDDSRGES